MRSYRVIQSLRNVLFLAFILSSFNLSAQSPGGVNSNIRLWLKANAGVTGATPVSGWADQSGNGFSATAPGAAPNLLTNQLNFNPVLDFTSASSQYLQINNGIMGASAYTNAWVYAVSKADIIQDQTLFFETLAGGEGLSLLAPWGNSNIYFDFGSIGGTGRINGTWGSSVNNYNLWTVGSGATASATPNGTNKIISRDGAVIFSNNNNDATIAGNNQNFIIGGGYSNGLGTTRPFDGKIAELIIFTGVPSPLEQEKVQSYLALKYGLTKNSADVVATAGQDEADYFASNGAVIWDYSANTTYHNNVAGIGRDNTSQLNQSQSLSSNTGADVTMTGTIATDLSFIVWGDNNAVNGTSTDVPAGYVKRINKVWKTNVTGTPGNVNFSIDLTDLGLPVGLNASDYALLIDGDGVFNSGAAIYTTGAAIAGGQLSFTNVPFADGNFFTIAVLSSALKGPANVTENLKLWLKANSGVTGTTPISAWADQSGNGFSATAPGNAPTLLSNQLNFNPTVDFNSTLTQYLQINNGIMGSSSYTNQWIYAVSKGDVLQNNTLFYEGLASGEYLDLLLPWGNLVYNDFGSTGAGRITGAWGGSINNYNVWTIGSSASAAAAPNGTNKAVSRDGSVILSNNNNDLTVTGNNQNFILGGGYSTGNGTTFNLDGKIAELIIFTGVPTPLEQEKIQSYLSLKYGLTKSSIDNVATAGQDEADYFASNGTVIWDYSANSTFHNNVAGIGRDNASQLNQSQSLSANTGADVTMTGSIASDLNFIVWGDNNAANGTSTDVPAGYVKRINKVWKTNVTGSPGTVNFSIDLTDLGLPIGLNASDYALLIDADGVFNSGATIYTTGAAVSNGQLSFTNVPFTDGSFFTIAVLSSALKGPANVTENLKLWLKANSGVTGASPISSWADQSGNGYTATAPGNAPTLLSNQLNFNPTVDFNSSLPQYLQINNGIMGSSSYTDQWIYAVSKGDVVQNNTLLYEGLAGGEYFDVLLPWGGNLVYNDFGSTGAGRITGSWGGSVNSYNVWTFGSSASAAAAPNGTNKIISRDGLVFLSNNNNDPTVAGNNQNFLIGGGYSTGNGTSFPLDGKIAELIIYTGVPTPLEQEKIQSYLSLKYGLTKNSIDNVATAGQDEADYFASSGAVIWDYSANTPYHNNVAGIGRDNASQLNQSQSLSANAGADVTMTGSIASDLSFIVWGDNNAANGTSTDVPAGYVKRINKIWKTNVTGTPGTVNFSIDLTDLGLPVGLNASDYALLIDGDGVFNAGASIYTTGAAIASGQLSFTNVPFTDGNFFTIAVLSSALKGPANVTDNLKLWLKANSGVTGTSPVSAWADQSGNGFSATAPGNAPVLLSNQLNYNPVVDFTSASSQYLQINNGIMGASPYTNAWIYAVSKADIVQQQTTFFETLAGGEYFSALLPWSNANTYFDFGNAGGGGRINGGWGASINNYYVWTLGSGASAAATPNGTNKIISRDGSVILSNNSNDASIAGNNQNFLIGAGYSNGLGTSNPFDGKLAELIIYTGIPTPLEQEKIQSYLSLKYGLTKNSTDVVGTAGQDEADYFSASGAVIWDYSLNTAYHNRVTGIGRDDASQLAQQRSQSAYSSILTLDKVTTFGVNSSFVVAGDDNGVLASTTSNVPSPYTARTTRIWKANVTGTPGAISLSFDLSSGIHNSGNVADYALMIKNADANFATGASIQRPEHPS